MEGGLHPRVDVIVLDGARVWQGILHGLRRCHPRASIVVGFHGVQVAQVLLRQGLAHVHVNKFGADRILRREMTKMRRPLWKSRAVEVVFCQCSARTWGFVSSGKFVVVVILKRRQVRLIRVQLSLIEVVLTIRRRNYWVLKITLAILMQPLVEPGRIACEES